MTQYLQAQTAPDLSLAIREYSRYRKGGLLVKAAREKNELSDGGELTLSLLLMQMLANEDPEIYSALGDRYYQGKGVREDQAKSLEMFRQAADRGSVRSMYDLGWYYYDRRENIQAIEYFERCIHAEAGLEPYMVGKSYSCLGACYANLPDPKYGQAIDNLTIAADKYQDAFAARRLAMLYGEQGSGQFSPDKCLHYLEQAAARGDMTAVELLGRYYLTGEESLGIQVNRCKAEQVLLPHAEEGSAVVLRFLGDLYRLGDSENGLSPDYEKARGFYRRCLALEPHSGTEANLGYVCYRLDQYREAEELLLKADRSNILWYNDFLGRMYKDGLLGPKDPDKALYYYGRAYEAGEISNLFTCGEYAELLEQTGNYQKSYAVAEYGHDKYNDVWFIFLKARLVLDGLVTGQISKDEAAELMEVCLYHDSHTLEAHRALARYYMSIQSYLQAEEHYLAAFQEGDSGAAVSLGRLYELGGGTIKPNPAKAYEWFVRAAETGSELGRREAACWKKGMLGGWRRVANVN